MARRAAICIGVDNAGSMTPLQAAARGARDFEAWARTQGCDTVLLVDGPGKPVGLLDVFDAVERFVKPATYDQLVVYFSGHGILTAPGAEFWLLSRAPQNPNEAVNLSRSVVDARNCGIPHVVFVSDACRSSVDGPPLAGVLGGVIFAGRGVAAKQGDVDLYYATRPGDPAYEVPEAVATSGYRGIFTDALLAVVRAPPPEMVDPLPQATTVVITSRKLKEYLEATVPVQAANVSVKLRQAPQVIVETALPKYFAEVTAVPVAAALAPATSFAPTVDETLAALGALHVPSTDGLRAPAISVAADRSGLANEMEAIALRRGRDHFETTTGFTVFGVGGVEAKCRSWRADAAFPAGGDGRSWHLRLGPASADAGRTVSSIVLDFEHRSGTVLAVYPGFIGTVIVEGDRVVSVDYVPSSQTARFGRHRGRADELHGLKAYAAVASRQGRLELPAGGLEAWSARFRQDRDVDPVLAVYAAYACAQAGAHADVDRILGWLQADAPELPVPFDVAMLATRRIDVAPPAPDARLAPFCPLLAQGWVLLAAGDALHQDIHEELRGHLIPALWTTLAPGGIEIATNAILSGRVR